ncbi:MAG TPA: glycosyltransferase [Chromatiaceae bacterium]|nr:glycosyltransferase [Chromatiaceae bacterium]
MKGRILLAHVFFDIIGGGEFLALNAARALRESGFDVTIFTCTPIDAGVVKRMLGIDVSGFNVVVRRVPVVDVVKRVSRGRFTRLRRLMAYKKFFTEYMDEIGRGYDLVMETQSNIVSPADISYIHYPALIYFYEKKGSGLHWRLYNWAVKLYADSFKRDMIPGRVLTNSTWTAAQIYRVHHIIADVVYPPVDVEYFSKVSGNDKREKLVVTISRFVEGKKLDKIVDVAAKLKDYVFILIGSTYEYSHRVLTKIERKVREYHLDNVVIETDLPRTKMLEYLREARFYLHPPYAEHFGIAIVEAMAAGLVPLVYRDGGA